MADDPSSSKGSPNPAPVLDLIEAFRRSKAMFAAVALGIFDVLGETRADGATLADHLGVNRDALERLLGTCVALGFLRKLDGVYSNQPVAETYLRRSSPHTLTGYILYSNNALYPMWGHLEDAVREGTHRWKQTFGFDGMIFDHFFRTEESRRDFITGMHGFGMISSPKVVGAFDLNRFKKFVDLGGATGHLVITACERYAALRGAIFDLEAVIKLAREFVSKSPVADRIELVAGDFFRDPLPQGDLYAVGRILHDWPDDKVAMLLGKIYGALPAGGGLLIAERILDEDKTGPLPALMQSLNMLICTEGKERTLSEFAALLREAGFAEVEGRRTGSSLDAILALKL
ncbi:MAG TPA: class I SAM-dependent methyltransferase [Terriglobia bacterium]|nr:class I SAM-dependent methyltransferase [Terriglobia bacterium]